MANSKNMTEKLIAEFTENYLENLFYFCLKKTGNNAEAEDLTQDITLNILTALNRGTIPTHFSAWVWRIARNRYSKWADLKHKKAESVAGTDIGEYEIEDDSESTLEQMIHREQLTLLRRELAFIGSEYRKIVAAYYLENKSIRHIATTLSLSEAAVKQRLYRARTKLKEGMNMAREFGIRSYQPEDVYYSMGFARLGDKKQPQSIMEHKLYANIFLEAYGNPSTAEALALELGVALPYMENELEYLTKESFLLKKDGKYQTAFPIISRPAQEQIHTAKLTAVPDITKAFRIFLEHLDAAFCQKSFAYYGSCVDYNKAKWTFLMLALQHFEQDLKPSRDFTIRPDNGQWDIVGYQCCPVTKPSIFVGNYVRRGQNCFFQQFTYQFEQSSLNLGKTLTEEDVKIIYNAATGNLSAKDCATAEQLTEWGYLLQNDDAYIPAIPVVHISKVKEMIDSLDTETLSELTTLADNVKAQLSNLYRTIAELVKKDLPGNFSEDTIPYHHAVYECCSLRGYLVAEALRQEYLTPIEDGTQSIGAQLDLL